MARHTVKVPDVGEGIAEVELVSWSVADGQSVERNQIIAEVMTDKATVEVPAPADGVVTDLNGSVGDILLVGSPLFALEVPGETPDEPAGEATGGDTVDGDGAADTGGGRPVAPAAGDEMAVAVAAPTVAGPEPGPARSSGNGSASSPVVTSIGAPRPEGRKPIATPAVRRRAREAGIDLRTVVGTGPAGRIGHDDLDAVFATAGTGTGGITAHRSGIIAPNNTVTDEPIVGIRRRIAEQMVASTSTIPHITYVEEIDMTALEELRSSLNRDRTDDQPRLTVLPFIIRALVNELPNFPAMNAHVIDDAASAERRSEPATLRTFGGVHVGIATQTDSGLVVPVLRHAESETLWTSAARIGELAEAARSGTATAADLTGSTVTITSLGALGGLISTPVINKPETTIIGVNKMTIRPVWSNEQFVPRQMMNLSSSFDHRVIDGWVAARFIQALKRSLEQPALLFVDRP